MIMNFFSYNFGVGIAICKDFQNLAALAVIALAVILDNAKDS